MPFFSGIKLFKNVSRLLLSYRINNVVVYETKMFLFSTITNINYNKEFKSAKTK